MRGHRRTYIGAARAHHQNLRKAASNNPVFLLDEVDKMSVDFRGDPASALLEVLDPEQNNTFVDHYLDLDYDLSDVMFVTTANSLHGIPVPLQDRMEIIELPGYTDHEKLQIARRYLIPKQRAANGLEDCAVQISDEAIGDAGAWLHQGGRRAQPRARDRRGLPQAGAQEGARAAAAWLPRHRRPRRGAARRAALRRAAQANGGRHRHRQRVGRRPYGGDLLATEVTVMPGKGKLALTGKLGDVMQESAQAALSYVRSRAVSLGLEPDFYQRVDVHVHCPEGAIPKDGPSAGITMATALVSALLRLPVAPRRGDDRRITLRGRVLAIGGLKEKLLAAHRSGIALVLIPEEPART
ncbi:MAG: AAA family ATPase [Proteobacteria bacterium]|nr:AAA family ATPase [Pseudomonadota bacterium]